MTQTEKLQSTVEILSGGKRALRLMLDEKKIMDPDEHDPNGYHWLVNVHNLIGSLIEDIQIEERQRIEKEIRALAALGGFDIQILTKEGKRLRKPKTPSGTGEKVLIETKRGEFVIKQKRGSTPKDLQSILKSGIKHKTPLMHHSDRYDVGVISAGQAQDVINKLKLEEF
ncbi:hypothetical protein [Shewanella sp. SE1]|uniref:hypothetical protein n=1 Tax=Shewanella sp. SE1 TaxID=2705014 RepID=UPI00138EE432|nr:hypothetical protein [Shewanella sp. SE1]NDO73085.1 hypothetical protein [Shewanella sp. SE1]